MFAEPSAELKIESSLQPETYVVERPAFQITPEAVSYPFIYSADDRIDLGRNARAPSSWILPIASAHGLEASYVAIRPIPTNGTIGGDDLIRVPVTRDISQAVPIAGGFVGTPNDYLGMTVDVSLVSESGGRARIASRS